MSHSACLNDLGLRISSSYTTMVTFTKAIIWVNLLVKIEVVRFMD